MHHALPVSRVSCVPLLQPDLGPMPWTQQQGEQWQFLRVEPLQKRGRTQGKTSRAVDRNTCRESWSCPLPLCNPFFSTRGMTNCLNVASTRLLVSCHVSSLWSYSHNSATQWSQRAFDWASLNSHRCWVEQGVKQAQGEKVVHKCYGRIKASIGGLLRGAAAASGIHRLLQGIAIRR